MTKSATRFGGLGGAAFLALAFWAGCEDASDKPKADPNPDDGGSSGTAGGGTGGSATPHAGNGGSAAPHAGAASEEGGGGSLSENGGDASGGSGGALAEGGAGGAAHQGCPPCDVGQYCDLETDACQQWLCTPDDPACDGNRLTTCNAVGSGYLQGGSRCLAAQSCEPSGCKSAGACPNVYIGTDRYGNRPLAPQANNDGLVMNSYDIKVDTLVFGQVRINNHGTDNSPSTSVELYWTDRVDSPATPVARFIGEFTTVVPGSAIGAESDEQVATNFSYTFPTVGKFYLLARLVNNSPPGGNNCIQQGYDSSFPLVDPQSAIHEINVVK